ncbi:collagen alpha-1(II) chain-like [Manacus candei]|uniref:collagen alpha-1(II) chain-like n=1 Tax=Manacus candei TaxID=415023 RepID=UPI002226C943|nr:collagen alpha-1(II) chain-like [Manacus candei]
MGWSATCQREHTSRTRRVGLALPQPGKSPRPSCEIPLSPVSHSADPSGFAPEHSSGVPPSSRSQLPLPALAPFHPRFPGHRRDLCGTREGAPGKEQQLLFHSRREGPAALPGCGTSTGRGSTPSPPKCCEGSAGGEQPLGRENKADFSAGEDTGVGPGHGQGRAGVPGGAQGIPGGSPGVGQGLPGGPWGRTCPGGWNYPRGWIYPRGPGVSQGLELPLAGDTLRVPWGYPGGISRGWNYPRGPRTSQGLELPRGLELLQEPDQSKGSCAIPGGRIYPRGIPGAGMISGAGVLGSPCYRKARPNGAAHPSSHSRPHSHSPQSLTLRSRSARGRGPFKAPPWKRVPATGTRRGQNTPRDGGARRREEGTAPSPKPPVIARFRPISAPVVVERLFNCHSSLKGCGETVPHAEKGEPHPEEGRGSRLANKLLK